MEDSNAKALTFYALREKRSFDVSTFMPMTECYVDICECLSQVQPSGKNRQKNSLKVRFC